MLEGERDKLLQMEEFLKARVVGQDEALVHLANAVRRSRSGLADPSKPIGSFLFLGPTGVGKTELTKALAEFMFDDEHALLRIDMSEYMEKHAVARLVGAPPGYVGYEEGGVITEAVRRRPYQVILFDEVEKAHPDVFNLLLQVLDDGRLTDGQGRTVDFRNTVIVLTSNLGSQILLEESKEEPEILKNKIMQIVQGAFRPEFINRLDEIIMFNKLSKANISGIANIQLDELRERLGSQGIELQVSDDALKLLGDKGYDPLYGARPLKRVIQRELQDPLAQKILAGDIKHGDAVKIDARDGALVIK